MITKILIMLGLTILQNAAFTLVSRARNSSSILFHAVAAIFSNGIWYLVIKQVVTTFDSWVMGITYIVGTVTGSVLMHYFSMNYLEKWFKAKV